MLDCCDHWAQRPTSGPNRYVAEHQGAVLGFAAGAAQYLGQACFPLMMVLLGANLARSARSTSSDTAAASSKGSPSSAVAAAAATAAGGGAGDAADSTGPAVAAKVPVLGVVDTFVVAAGRLVVVPTVNMWAVLAAQRWGLLPTARDDPMVTFVLLLEGCVYVPTMLGLARLPGTARRLHTPRSVAAAACCFELRGHEVARLL